MDLYLDRLSSLEDAPDGRIALPASAVDRAFVRAKQLPNPARESFAQQLAQGARDILKSASNAHLVALQFCGLARKLISAFDPAAQDLGQLEARARLQLGFAEASKLPVSGRPAPPGSSSPWALRLGPRQKSAK